jgi:hypothetical protein
MGHQLFRDIHANPANPDPNGRAEPEHLHDHARQHHQPDGTDCRTDQLNRESVMNVNVGEYGIALNLNVNYDISAFTTLELDITRPDSTTITRANGPVTVGAVPLVTTDGGGTFAANQYASYLIQAGDLTAAGVYRVRLIYTDASKRLVSDVTSFEVQQ